MAKLKLNDSSFSYDAESSSALGLGFRCGFLGLLHLEIVQERLEREFDLDLVTTAPSVIYEISMKDSSTLKIHNPADWPDITKIDTIRLIDTFVIQQYDPTLINNVIKQDCVIVINNERVKISYKYDTIKEQIIHSIKLPNDTIYKEKNKTNKKLFT